MRMNKMDEKLLVCACHNVEHQLIIEYDKEDNLAYFEIHLNKLPLWERLKHAIKYTFGYKCKYGDFDELIIDSKYADYFIELGTKLKENAPE